MTLPGAAGSTSSASRAGLGPRATFLYGAPRTSLNRVAYALARATDPDPTWVDLREGEVPLDPPGPVELGWIPAERLFFVEKSDARPQDALANMGLWTVVRSDEPRAVIAEISDFLRLPDPIQAVVGQLTPRDEPPVLVVANTDRVREHYPRDVGGVRPIVETLLRRGAVPIFAGTPPPGAGRFAFDVVLELEIPNVDRWQEGFLRVEQAPEGSTFRTGSSVPLGEMPLVAAAMEGRRPSPT